MIPVTGWSECAETISSDVLRNVPHDSRRAIYRLDRHGFTWRSIELVHEAFGDRTSIACALSFSGSVALYDYWSQIEGIDLDIAGAWSIALGHVIFYYTNNENNAMAKVLLPLLSGFPAATAAAVVTRMSNSGYKDLALITTLIEHDIDPDILLALLESDNEPVLN